MSNSGGKSVITRRQALRRAAVIGGAVWAAPVIQSLGSPAFANHPGSGGDVCVDGSGDKPTELRFKFIGGSCTPSETYTVDCDDCDKTLPADTGYPLYINWNVQKGGGIKGSGDVTITATGQQFTVALPGQDISNNIAFTICKSSNPCPNARDKNSGAGTPDCTDQVMHIAIHTSCSAPLLVGDKYGTLELIGGFTT